MGNKSIFNLKNISVIVAAYALSFSLTYAFYPANSTSSLISPNAEMEKERNTAGFSQFADKPKTEICPINGALYSKEEKDLWQQKRPILAMIENSVEARPQSGLSAADIVYEAVAEGGITRFMGVFYCGAQDPQQIVGPVRSARIYFVNIATEYNTPIYMHVGGGNCSRDEASGQCTSNKKAFALEELQKLGWRKPGGNDFDTIGDIGAPVMKRDFNRLGPDVQLATEHTYLGFLGYAWKEADKRGYNNTMPKGDNWLDGFTAWKTGQANTTGSPATTVSYNFWDNQPKFDVSWSYDANTKTYLRNLAGQPHIDLDNKKQLSATNVIIQFAKEEGPLDEHKHMYYNVIGSGTGYYFHDGIAEDILWKKPKQMDRTIFTDKSGKEITFDAGQFWVSILPTGNKVVYN